jgi:hypothetical protein
LSAGHDLNSRFAACLVFEQVVRLLCSTVQ